jgi:hypothetical protein
LCVTHKRQWGGSFTHSDTHTGLGRVWNMKVCVLGSYLTWWKHILLSNSWPSRCPFCDQSLLLCFHSSFHRRRGKRESR